MTTIAWLGITTVAGAQGAAIPPASPPGTVTLSLADYNRLLDRAENPARPPDTPPIPSVVARADVSVRVTGSGARGTYTLDGEVFRAGATKVPLVSDATILSATLGDSPVPMVTDATRPRPSSTDRGLSALSSRGVWPCQPPRAARR